ncbi:MAG: hypothetical protein K8R53_05140 [Bacteroidales bacterium]|nr:hypothetical protein [Bacteroidales bacterium]
MKTKLLILLFCCLFYLPLSSQITEEINKINADSLQQILPVLVGTEKIDVLNKLALSYSRDNPDSCISMATRTKRLSEEQEYRKGIADASLYIGKAYLYLDSLKPVDRKVKRKQELWPTSGSFVCFPWGI